MASASAAAPVALLDHPSDFATRRASLRAEILALWNATPPGMPQLGPRVGFLRQRSTARAAARLIDDVIGEIEHVPEGESERRAWRDGLRERLQRFGHE